jgi:hypothetical protein
MPTTPKFCAMCGPGVTHTGLYLHSRCHPTSPTWTVLEQDHPEMLSLRVECATCGKLVERFRFALAAPEVAH